MSIMHKTFLFFGKQEGLESYQIIANRKYRTASFRGFSNRELFFDKVTDYFVQFLMQQQDEQRIYFFNGRRFNIGESKIQTIAELEGSLAMVFHNLVLSKYKLLRRLTHSKSQLQYIT